MAARISKLAIASGQLGVGLKAAPGNTGWMASGKRPFFALSAFFCGEQSHMWPLPRGRLRPGEANAFGDSRKRICGRPFRPRTGRWPHRAKALCFARAGFQPGTERRLAVIPNRCTTYDHAPQRGCDKCRAGAMRCGTVPRLWDCGSQDDCTTMDHPAIDASNLRHCQGPLFRGRWSLCFPGTNCWWRRQMECLALRGMTFGDWPGLHRG
jgi:hypothetical protein